MIFYMFFVTKWLYLSENCRKVLPKSVFRMQHGRFLIAEAPFRKQYGALNIWEEPNGKIVGTLKDGAQVTHYGKIELDNGEMWAQIGNKQFVNMAFLQTK